MFYSSLALFVMQKIFLKKISLVINENLLSCNTVKNFSSIHVMHFQFINNKDMNFRSLNDSDSNWRCLICIMGAVKVYVTLFQMIRNENFTFHIESWVSWVEERKSWHQIFIFPLKSFDWILSFVQEGPSCLMMFIATSIERCEKKKINWKFISRSSQRQEKNANFYHIFQDFSLFQKFKNIPIQFICLRARNVLQLPRNNFLSFLSSHLRFKHARTSTNERHFHHSWKIFSSSIESLESRWDFVLNKKSFKI